MQNLIFHTIQLSYDCIFSIDVSLSLTVINIISVIGYQYLKYNSTIGQFNSLKSITFTSISLLVLKTSVFTIQIYFTYMCIYKCGQGKKITSRQCLPSLLLTVLLVSGLPLVSFINLIILWSFSFCSWPLGFAGNSNCKRNKFHINLNYLQHAIGTVIKLNQYKSYRGVRAKCFFTYVHLDLFCSHLLICVLVNFNHL